MSAFAAPALRCWSTDAVAPSQRLDYWVGAICEGFLEMDASSRDPARFNAELVSAPLGGIGVNRVRAGAQDVYRTRRGIARSRENFFYLLCKTDAPWSTSQHGREARLQPGDLALVDSRACYELHFPTTASTVSLELPIAWVDRWLPGTDDLLAIRIDGQSGWGLALSSFARQLQPELAAAPPLPPDLLVDQLGTLLALAAGGESTADQRQGQAALRSRVLDAIRERHTEPGLTARCIARGLGISERSLHRCLMSGDCGFAQALTVQRMASARRMLADRRFDRLTVGEIGRRVGLLDASHFVRQCRRQLGKTPGALRRER